MSIFGPCEHNPGARTKAELILEEVEEAARTGRPSHNREWIIAVLQHADDCPHLSDQLDRGVLWTSCDKPDCECKKED